MSSPSGLVVMSQQVSTLESASFGFDDGAGVMGDQPAQHGVAQVPGAIELVQAREGKAGGVADVVQPCGGFQQMGVSAEDWCQAACRSRMWHATALTGLGLAVPAAIKAYERRKAG